MLEMLPEMPEDDYFLYLDAATDAALGEAMNAEETQKDECK